MQVVLVMFRSDGERRSFSVVRNMTVIGRREDCDLRIPVGDVSRKHCRLVRTDDGIRIEDLGSSNGTYVNGQRIQESELNPGDAVGIGPVQFIVQIDGVPDEEQMTAPAARPAPVPPEDGSVAGESVDVEVPEGEFATEAVPEAADGEEFQIEEEPVAQATDSDEILTEIPAESSLADDEFELEEEPVAGTTSPAPVSAGVQDLHAPEEIPLEESPAVEEPLVEEPLEELSDEFAEDATASHAAAPATDPARAETIQEVNLEAESTDELQPVDLEAGSESEWDFVIEENDGERSSDEFKVDLDSPHGQPHGQA